MRSCTCETEGICVACRHTFLPEFLPLGHKQWPPFQTCHPNARLGVNRDTGTQYGGCPDCWSKTVWRWHCTACRFKTAWVEDNLAAEAERRVFAEHHPTAWGAHVLA